MESFDPNTNERKPARTARAARTAAIRSRDGRLAALAASQRGVVSTDQLHELGFTEDAVHRKLGRSLFPVGSRVYAVGHLGLSRRGKGVALLLQSGAGSALSYESAARAWGITEQTGTGPIHVSVPDRRKLVLPDWAQAHRPRDLRPSDIVEHRGLRLTSPERTLIDLLPRQTVQKTTRMLELMVTTLNRSPDDLHAWANGLSKLPGKCDLMLAMDHIAGPAVIRSQFEALFRSVCQAGDLPPARTNHRMGRWEIDAIYLDMGVAIELDSYRFHGGRWAFHRDRRKGVALSRAGFELVRISWPQLKHDPQSVVEAVAQALERGRLRHLGRTVEAGLASRAA